MHGDLGDSGNLCTFAACSHASTADYLKSYFHEDVSLDQICRYMDKLYNKQRELVQQISVEHTRKILGGSIGLMFYDVTSLSPRLVSFILH